MNPDFGITVDTSEFTRALREYAATSQRTLAEILNRKAYWIAWKAFRYSPRADRQKIVDLGVREYHKTGKRGKELKAITRDYTADNLRAVYVGLLRKRNLLYEQGTQINAETIKEHFSRRLGGIGYLASGWVRAIRKLSKHIGQPANVDVAGKAKGYAKLAQEGAFPVVEFANLAEAKFGFAPGTPARMLAAFKRAFDEETQTMHDQAIRRMQLDADKVNAR